MLYVKLFVFGVLVGRCYKGEETDLILINGGGAEVNKEHGLFNDVVCHKVSNCGLFVYYKLNLAIPRLIFLLVLGIEDLAVRCGSNAQGEGVNVSSDSCSPHLHLQNFDWRAPLVLLRS